ncbi:bifunctional diguanylate cyclase/phosphodiesterase [Neptuniibacter sp.]|uniref:sensor domain-containing protein n=1 Tax=Neptuniibacter sp. TaxID=1962643 RepID=UPI0026218AB8|nr:bifunctional diguanylate cyclase/phosphodiesterase [Neptuniibacter sp.]MCP4596569.1 EAL domain-containing protein [Neptuniibacter sp.]
MKDLQNLPVKTISIYLLVSVPWILLSDWVVTLFPAEHQHLLQTSKGWLFVAITSFIIYMLLKRACDTSSELDEKLEETVHDLAMANRGKQAVLNAMPVSVWEEDFSQIKKYIDDYIKPENSDVLRQWFDDTPEGVFLLAGKVKTLSIGGSTLEMFRANSKPELLDNLQNVFTEASLRAFREEIIALYDGQHYFNIEAEQRRLDGSTFQTSTSVSLPSTSLDSWDRVIVCIEDISHKQAAEKAMDVFFDLDMNLHIIADLDSTILRVNHGWNTVLGYEREELEGKPFLNFVHEDDMERTLSEMASLKSGQTTYYFENRYKHKNGDYRYLAWSAIAPEGGSVIYAVATDITEKKISELKLRDAASVINNTSEGVMLTELDGTIKEVNGAFTSITGYSRAEVIGQTPSILKSGRHDAIFYNKIWNGISDTGYWQGEIWNRKKNGEIYPELLTIDTIKDEEGRPSAYVSVFTDISLVKNAENRLIHVSTHDALTGLANRSLLDEQLDHAIKHAKRVNTIAALLLLDIDNFKYINDSLGFNAGDQLLRQISSRISASTRADDTIARLGSDEFAIVLEGIEYSKQVSQVVENLLENLKPPFQIEGNEIYISASAGISLYPHDSDTGDGLIRNANSALTKAKESGKGIYLFYAEELTSAALEYLLIENALRTALEKDQFYLVYQPQFDLVTGMLEGMETLIRWNHPDLGTIPPGKFIPIAERSKLINDIGLWVLTQACLQGKKWLDQGYDIGRIAVNVSVPQAMRSDLALIVEQVLETTAFPAVNLELEVTETFAMKDPETSIKLLGMLRDKGIEIAVDDFGTGYSSLSYLKKLPIDKLKIDQSFTASITSSKDDQAIVDAIISLGDSLSLKTIAEGVETSEQLDLLKSLGCQQGQGYLYSKPVGPDEFERLFLGSEG